MKPINAKFEELLRGGKDAVPVLCPYCGSIDRYRLESDPERVTYQTLKCSRCAMKIRVKL